MNEVTYFYRKNTWSGRFEPHGWGNGYVCIPKGHPLYGQRKKIKDLVGYKVIGGVTFAEHYSRCKVGFFVPIEASGKFIIGFDTVYPFCDLVSHDEAFVKNETHKLYELIVNYNKNN